jgi:hypothetical protein
MAQPPRDHAFVKTTETEAAAAVRIGAGLGQRKRAELLELMRPSFVRAEPWLQAGKYVSAVLAVLHRSRQLPTSPRTARPSLPRDSAPIEEYGSRLGQIDPWKVRPCQVSIGFCHSRK